MSEPESEQATQPHERRLHRAELCLAGAAFAAVVALLGAGGAATAPLWVDQFYISPHARQMGLVEAEAQRLAQRVAAAEKKAADAEARAGALAAENQALAQRLGAIDQRLPALSQSAAVLAMSQLMAALRQSAPFERELATVLALAGDDGLLSETLAPLMPVAGRGVPTTDELRGRFPAMVAQMRATHWKESPTGRFLDEWTPALVRMAPTLTAWLPRDPLGGMIGAPSQPDRFEEMVATATARVMAGDLVGAAGELARAPAETQALTGAWLSDLRLRMMVDATTPGLEGSLGTRLAAARNGRPLEAQAR
ncbi:MAG: hypothetical protein HQL41_04590 [Alphaproteobacteria bacterium]|nr:hypothetical protein [Alphaproteobacteria bacterium]